jgi:hypothetical protein
MRPFLAILLASAVIVGAGCATTPAAPPSVNVTGNWSGTWSYENPLNGTGTLMGSFKQDGANLAGNFNVTGPVVTHAANNVVGTVAGNEIKLSLPSSGTLTVNGNEITGWINGLNPAKVTLRKQ